LFFFKEKIPKFLWTDKGKEFYNKNVDKILKQYSIKLYSTENKEKKFRKKMRKK